MDFFEAQTRAKKRTSRLVVLFALAVLGTILAAYAAAIIGLTFLNDDHAPRRHRSAYYASADSDSQLSTLNSQLGAVRPGLFLAVTATTLAVVGLASLTKWTQFSSGGSAVAESVGGRRVDPRTTDLHERRLLNVVEEMAIASGTPVPTVYILDDEPAINAFAAGLTTSDAVVTVTRGTLEKLTRDELQGVVGHEFSHILNGDMRLNVRLTALLFGILVLGLAGRGLLWGLRGARFSRGNNKNSGGIVAFLLFAGLALIVIGYVGYFFGRLIQAAVSRQREFLADASAVQFTRNPLGLSGALKKIGGYALGSSLNTSKATAIGHFFFAQSFRSGLTGLWATHPPLDERLRAIDPNFDGKYFEPPEVVDIARESFVTAGLAPAPARTPTSQLRSPAAAQAAVLSAGTLTPDQLADAHLLLARTPELLLQSARTPDGAQTLVLALVLDDDVAVRARQFDLLPPETAQKLSALEPALHALGPEQKFPLFQLALPAFREITSAELTSFLAQLDQLMHADGRISPFEFALRKTLTRSLALSRDPAAAVVQYYSFNALVAEIAVVLSILAHASVFDSSLAPAAFAAGAAQIKLIESRLRLLPPVTDFAALDAALDKLAAASLPIKQRVLIAATHVVAADGRVLITEAELLRAFSATLDIPLPPLS